MVWILLSTISFRLYMYQATSTPSHIFTKQHLIKHRDFTLTFSDTGTGQDFCDLAVYLTPRFIIILADKHNSTFLYKHNGLNQKNMIQCTLKYLHLKQFVHMQCCYHVTQNTSPWTKRMAAGCADFPLSSHEQYQIVFEQFKRCVLKQLCIQVNCKKFDIVLEHKSHNPSHRLL